jgi:hypothetical protein
MRTKQFSTPKRILYFTLSLSFLILFQSSCKEKAQEAKQTTDNGVIRYTATDVSAPADSTELNELLACDPNHDCYLLDRTKHRRITFGAELSPDPTKYSVKIKRDASGRIYVAVVKTGQTSQNSTEEFDLKNKIFPDLR